MMVRRSGGGLALVLTFVIAFMLMILPLPALVEPLRPAWVTVVLVYWTMAVPQRVGVSWAWFTGLLKDGVAGTLLGQYALGLALVAFIVIKLHQRMRVLPLWQQGVGVFVLVLLEQSLFLWTRGIQGLPSPWLLVLGPAAASGVVWPWIFIILRDVRRRYRIE